MASGPRYHEIAAQLRSAIERGELAEGQQLPTEAELMAQFEVSRNTVRLALRRLSDEGLVVSGQGRGTFVRTQHRPFVWNWTELESRSKHALSGSTVDQWAVAVEAANRDARQEVRVSIEQPSPEIARRLGLPEDSARTLVRQRIRYVDHQPYQLADSYFPLHLVQDSPLMEPGDVSAPGGVLASIGLVQVRYYDEITVRMPTRRETELLNLAAATPVAEHSRTGYAADGTALRVMVTILPGDRHVIAYDVAAD